MTQKRSPCPRCLSKDIATIQYGMPVEMPEQVELGKVVLGGCCISEQSPKWQCQRCGYEFGKYMPSFENLEHPEPDGIKPLKLEFWIGGFTGPNHSVKLENGVLKYQLDYPVKEIEIMPTGRKWLNFRKKLDAINVWKWKRNYVNTDICDGTQWKFEIDYGVKKKKIYGDNSYPGCEGKVLIDDEEENHEFDDLLHALSLLVGGVKIV